MTINPNNYPGTNITLVGTAGGAVDIRTLGSSSVAQLSVAVGKGYKNAAKEWVDTGTDWYTLSASPEYARENWPEVGSGDRVRIDDARLELKPYLTKAGEARVDAQLRWGTLTVVESKSSRGNTSVGSSADTPF